MSKYGARPGAFGLGGWLTIVAVGAAGYGGWWLYKRSQGAGHATLSCSLRPDTETPASSQADCFATFHKEPPGGELTDVRVELSGRTLSEPGSYDWGYLAPLDQREGKIPPGSGPPLGRELRWRMPIHLVNSLTPEIGDFVVKVKLYWAGKLEDTALFNTKSVYQPK